MLVKGDGYTNHCPGCLFSKHVDVNPGDRAEECGGLMAPVEVQMKAGEPIIIHQCLKCGFTRPNKLSKGDDYNALVEAARKKANNLL
jgi:hypothetical protein